MKYLITITTLLFSTNLFAMSCITVQQAEDKLATIAKNEAFAASLPSRDHLLNPSDRFKIKLLQIKQTEKLELRKQELNDIIAHKDTCTK
jgi:hypothetical protein